MPGTSNNSSLTRRRGSDRSLSGSAHELAVCGVNKDPTKVVHSHSQSNLSEIPYRWVDTFRISFDFPSLFCSPPFFFIIHDKHHHRDTCNLLSSSLCLSWRLFIIHFDSFHFFFYSTVIFIIIKTFFFLLSFDIFRASNETFRFICFSHRWL